MKLFQLVEKKLRKTKDEEKRKGLEKLLNRMVSSCDSCRFKWQKYTINSLLLSLLEEVHTGNRDGGFTTAELNILPNSDKAWHTPILKGLLRNQNFKNVNSFKNAWFLRKYRERSLELHNYVTYFLPVGGEDTDIGLKRIYNLSKNNIKIWICFSKFSL